MGKKANTFWILRSCRVYSWGNCSLHCTCTCTPSRQLSTFPSAVNATHTCLTPLPPTFFCTHTQYNQIHHCWLKMDQEDSYIKKKTTHHTWRLASPLLWTSLTEIEAVQTDASVLHKVCDADAMAAVQRWGKSIWNTLLCIQFIIYLWWFTIGLYNRWKP